MLVTLTPGADRQRVLELLHQASLMIDDFHGKRDEYMQWVMNVARVLRGQISRADLEELFLTPTFDRIVAGQGTGTMFGQRLLEAEIAERQVLLSTAIETLKGQIEAWNVSVETQLVVVDTSVFLHHPSWTADAEPTKVIASIPWAKDLELFYTELLIVLPEVVIKELDRLKESSNMQIRYRARVTLAVIDKLLADPYGTVRIRGRDADWRERDHCGEAWRGGVQLKVFYNDPGYRSPGDEDEEIIDRTRALMTLSGKDVRLITMDTTMGLNGRRFNLKVTKPAREIEAPAEGQSRRAQRREAAVQPRVN